MSLLTSAGFRHSDKLALAGGSISVRCRLLNLPVTVLTVLVCLKSRERAGLSQFYMVKKFWMILNVEARKDESERSGNIGHIQSGSPRLLIKTI